MDLNRLNAICENAKDLFTQGPNCAECVLIAILNSNTANIKKEDVRFATGFGGGIGKYGLTCGALTGAVICVSSVYGREDPFYLKEYSKIKSELSAENGVYSIFNSLVKEFENEMGSTVCKEILDVEGDDIAKLKFEKCQKAVGIAAGLAYKYINENKKECI